MTASELGYLATGLLLGAAIGAAFLMILGNRPSKREIRLTVTHGAVPSRSETLSEGALGTGRSIPAAGGPGDRRLTDRVALSVAPAAAETAVLAPMASVEIAVAGAGSDPLARPGDRTIVPSGPLVGIEIHPEPDPELAALTRRPAPGAPIERMLRGDHRAMVEVVDRVAGTDSRQRRAWEVLLGGLVEALGEVAVRESVIDFPMGTAFWDSFTIEQCRRIVAALDSMGYRYDGRDGWREGRVPAYRDLTRALADIGLEPRRVRAWPNAAEIGTLFVGARPAPEELLPAAGPDYRADDMRAVLGDHAATLADLWIAWDSVQPILFEEAPVRVAEAEVGAATPAG